MRKYFLHIVVYSIRNITVWKSLSDAFVPRPLWIDQIITISCNEKMNTNSLNNQNLTCSGIWGYSGKAGSNMLSQLLLEIFARLWATQRCSFYGIHPNTCHPTSGNKIKVKPRLTALLIFTNKNWIQKQWRKEVPVFINVVMYTYYVLHTVFNHLGVSFQTCLKMYQNV